MAQWNLRLRRSHYCFVGGSDLAGVNRLAQQLDGARGLALLGQVVDRWVDSACLCFALDFEQQKRSGFRHKYSCYQMEYSRKLVFKSGRQMAEVYQSRADRAYAQGLIERTRRVLDVARRKTVFGRKQRPSKTKARASSVPRQAAYDLHKLRGKSLVERIEKTRRYPVRRPAVRTRVALQFLREQVIERVLAGVCRSKRGRPPKTLDPLDDHYRKLQREMPATLQTVKLAA